MHQIEHKKLTNKDPSIEAIYNKRALFIENIYNKNLRPIIETQDSADNIGVQQQTNNELQQVSTGNFRADSKLKAIDQQLMSRAGSLIVDNGLISERTELSFATAFDDLKGELGSRGKDYVNDGGISVYEESCRDLKLVPCSNIIKSLPTTIISLNNYGLGSSGTLALSQALKSNLTVIKLELVGNSIGPFGMKHLARMFEENSTISDLNISNNDIGTKGAKYLVELFKKNRFLRDLDISKNEFNDDDGIILAEALEDQQLLRINMSHNGFSEKSGVSFGKWLADNNTLIELDLSWNHIRKKGALMLAKGIGDNNKLIKVNLSWNGFENEGAEAMGKALTHNVILQELHLKCNRIGPAGFAKLCASLKDNTILRKLYVGKNNINEEAVEAVMKLYQSLPLNLELLDITEVSLKPIVEDYINATKAVHPKLKCLHGFLNLGEKRTYNPCEEALKYINMYCADNSISLMDLFAKLDSDGSMAVSYDEFRDGLKKARIPITPLQIDALIKYLDKDGDGEIDFSELVIGDEQARKAKKNEENDE